MDSILPNNGASQKPGAVHFVLFEVIHIGNARSETISLFRLSPLRNPLLLVGTATALAVHLTALYTSGVQGLLGIEPISARQWLDLAVAAAGLVAVMELHKWARRRWPVRQG